MMSEAERRKREERERKKAEVRARLEAQTSKAAKKGFMTGERKKKLRILLRRKAAEELKRQQEIKATERRKVIAERAGTKLNFDTMTENELNDICKKYHERLRNLENGNWDLKYEVDRREIEIHETSLQVSNTRGKFVKPPLKRVPKYEQKIEKMLLNARKEVGFTIALKSVKKDQFKVEDNNKNQQAPDWSWMKNQQAKEEAELAE